MQVDTQFWGQKLSRLNSTYIKLSMCSHVKKKIIKKINKMTPVYIKDQEKIGLTKRPFKYLPTHKHNFHHRLKKQKLKLLELC